MLFEEGGSYKLLSPNPGVILCQNLTGYDEKNWSLWSYNNRMMISYHLSPKHIVFKPEVTRSLCQVLFEDSINIFSRIKEYYGLAIDFSLSTPAVPISSQRYLGMGHLKLFPSAIASSDTNAWQANLHLANLPTHAFKNTRYFMFLYTFDPETLEIVEISHAFLPPGTQSNVVFPTGLIIEGDRIIISYGEQDSRMKLLFISLDEVNQMLRPDLTPQTFDFIRY